MSAPSSPPASPASVPSPSALSPVPPPVPVETHPNRRALKRLEQSQPSPDSGFLTPEDAYKPYSPPRLRPLHEVTSSGVASLNGTLQSSQAASAAAVALRPAVASLRPPPAIPVSARREQGRKGRSTSRKTRPPAGWKKLLWIRQPYPDNYTDAETFLDHLQRNPKLRPYDFWPLVSDSTVIVQHVCSVAVFTCCFSGIYQDRISPVSVVSLSSLATIFGWSLWDYWMGQEEEELATAAVELARKAAVEGPTGGSTSGSEGSFNSTTMNGNGHTIQGHEHGLGLSLSMSNLTMQNHGRKLSKPSRHSHSLSANSFQSVSSISPLAESCSEAFPPLESSSSPKSQGPPHSGTTLSPSLSPRVQSRLKTAKSALLIYLTLLGLSPILKSLTRSTSSDSIWALATWLLIINIFFFDYSALYIPPKPRLHPYTDQKSLRSGFVADAPALAPTHGSPGSAPPFPSSLSTNAALMASTVLASRLPSITHVFSLTVFSIEVFGLFPVFRRHLRQMSWNGHVLLTIFLVMASSTGMSIILSTSYTHTYGACGFCWGWIWHILTRSVLGMMIGGFGTSLVMGGCSWWLISLQRYKNVVIGPWDPARPVLTGGPLARGRGSSG